LCNKRTADLSNRRLFSLGNHLVCASSFKRARRSKAAGYGHSALRVSHLAASGTKHIRLHSVLNLFRRYVCSAKLARKSLGCVASNS
jgi:hypothetical protein